MSIGLSRGGAPLSVTVPLIEPVVDRSTVAAGGAGSLLSLLPQRVKARARAALAKMRVRRFVPDDIYSVRVVIRN